MTALEFENIFKATKTRLSAIARQYGRAVSFDLDEDDVVQEALIALWELSEKGYPIRNPEALLIKITKNICVGRYRKQKGRTEALGAEAYRIASAEPESGLIDEKDVKKLFEECLTKTEFRYMMMKIEDDMTLDEMAASTGKTKEGIKMAISRGRKKLQEQLNRFRR